MKVIKAFGPCDLRIVEKPIPHPPAGHVRIKVRASGICGSDKWVWSVPAPTDKIAGHEVAGDVDLLGEGVTQLSLGDRIMINNVGGCGTCPACRAGDFVLCPTWDGHLDVNNGFSEYVIAPARNCQKIHPSLDYIDGALIMDNWGTPYGGILSGGIVPGMDVLVSGCGPIGLAAVALCKAFGIFVMAVDPLPSRREAALRMGAAHVFAPEELPHAVQKISDGLGVHAVIECSGHPSAYEAGLASLRIDGTFVCIGEHAKVLLHPSDTLIRRHLRMVGSWYSTMAQGQSLQEMAVAGKFRPKDLLTHTLRLEDTPAFFGPVVECAPGILKCVIVME